MAAMAGALGVVLEKRGAYRLGADLRTPEAPDIGRAVRVMAGAASRDGRRRTRAGSARLSVRRGALFVTRSSSKRSQNGQRSRRV